MKHVLIALLLMVRVASAHPVCERKHVKSPQKCESLVSIIEGLSTCSVLADKACHETSINTGRKILESLPRIFDVYVYPPQSTSCKRIFAIDFIYFLNVSKNVRFRTGDFDYGNWMVEGDRSDGGMTYFVLFFSKEECTFYHSKDIELALKLEELSK